MFTVVTIVITYVEFVVDSLSVYRDCLSAQDSWDRFCNLLSSQLLMIDSHIYLRTIRRDDNDHENWVAHKNVPNSNEHNSRMKRVFSATRRGNFILTCVITALSE